MLESRKVIKGTSLGQKSKIPYAAYYFRFYMLLQIYLNEYTIDYVTVILTSDGMEHCSVKAGRAYKKKIVTWKIRK